MILTKAQLDYYLLQNHLTISKEKHDAILDYFSEEPGDGFAWSEQDIWEQVRKMVK